MYNLPQFCLRLSWETYVRISVAYWVISQFVEKCTPACDYVGKKKAKLTLTWDYSHVAITAFVRVPKSLSENGFVSSCVFWHLRASLVWFCVELNAFFQMTLQFRRHLTTTRLLALFLLFTIRWPYEVFFGRCTSTSTFRQFSVLCSWIRIEAA